MELSNQTLAKSRSKEIEWIAVAAMTNERVIGQEGELPWHLPGDLKFFKKLTTGEIVLMGRKTHESIGRPLPNRRNIVLSRSDLSLPGIEIFSSIDTLVTELRPKEKIFIIGGAEIYKLTIALWTEVFLTRVKGSFEGDTFFPEFENKYEAPKVIASEQDFRIEHYLIKK